MSTNASTGLARRTVRGSLYSLSASGITVTLGFARSILLARLLAPEHFGTVALALFFIGLVTRLRALGLDNAFLHQQHPDESFLRTYFTGRVALDVVAFGLLLAGTPLLGRAYPHVPDLPRVLPALIGFTFLSNLSIVQEMFLRKNLAFGRLAVIDVVASLTMTFIAPYLAWRGWGVWALVAEQGSGLSARFLLSWGLFRSWSPRLGWDRAWARWLWNYGRSVWVAANLSYLLDTFDDFWVGTVLGKTPLGYYNRSYEFARYTRRVFASPLVSVFGPVFARLQDDRRRLSQAYYRTAHLILRTSFLIAGTAALVMPEFIHYVIGDKWQPMLWTFRLMLVYAVLDPLFMLTSSLFFVTGRPQVPRRAAVVRTLFFIPAVIVAAATWGILGVALAADLMLVIGFWAMYRPLKATVDFSTSRLVVWPLLAFAVAFGVGLGVEQASAVTSWTLAALKSALFMGLFTLLLLARERDNYAKGWAFLWHLWRRQQDQP